MRLGVAFVRGARGHFHVPFAHEYGKGLRGHRDENPQHAVFAHSAPTLRMAQQKPDWRHHPEMHAGCRPHSQLYQRPDDGACARGFSHRRLTRPDVLHERKARAYRLYFYPDRRGVFHDLLRHRGRPLPHCG